MGILEVAAILLVLGFYAVPLVWLAIAEWRKGTARIIRANEFVLVDRSGNVRAKLSVSEEDGPSLTMWDEYVMNLRAGLVHEEAGPNEGFLGRWDENGNRRKGKLHVALSVSEEGAMLGMGDKNGTLRAGLFVDEEGPQLGMMDDKGKIRGSLFVNDKDGPMLSLRDEEGNPIWQAP